ncbi:MAG: hypothetical protein ACAH83_17745 [Alphaproteobacteria bacterium]
MKIKDVFNWCATDINNVSPITIPRLVMYPFKQMTARSTAFPTGAGDYFTDYFCRGARIAERTVTLGSVPLAIMAGTAVSGGLGIAAGLGVYTLGAIFGFVAGHEAHHYFRPVTPEQVAAYEAAERNKPPENGWMSAAGKTQYETAKKNKKPFDALKRKLTRIVHFKHYM